MEKASARKSKRRGYHRRRAKRTKTLSNINTKALETGLLKSDESIRRIVSGSSGKSGKSGRRRSIDLSMVSEGGIDFDSIKSEVEEINRRAAAIERDIRIAGEKGLDLLRVNKRLLDDIDLLQSKDFSLKELERRIEDSKLMLKDLQLEVQDKTMLTHNTFSKILHTKKQNEILIESLKHSREESARLQKELKLLGVLTRENKNLKSKIAALQKNENKLLEIQSAVKKLRKENDLLEERAAQLEAELGNFEATVLKPNLERLSQASDTVSANAQEFERLKEMDEQNKKLLSASLDLEVSILNSLGMSEIIIDSINDAKEGAKTLDAVPFKGNINTLISELEHSLFQSLTRLSSTGRVLRKQEEEEEEEIFDETTDNEEETEEDSDSGSTSEDDNSTSEEYDETSYSDTQSSSLEDDMEVLNLGNREYKCLIYLTCLLHSVEQVSKKEVELESLIEDLGTLGEILQDKKEQYSETVKKKDSIEEEKLEKIELMNKLVDIKTKLSGLRKDLDKALKQQQALSRSAENELLKRKSDLEKQLFESNTKNEEILNSIQKEREALSKKLKKEIEQARAEHTKEMEQTSAKFKNEIAQTISEYKARIDPLAKKLESLQQSSHSMEHRLAMRNLELKEMEKTFDDATRKLEEQLNQDIKGLDEELEILLDTEMSIRESIKAAAKKISNYQSANDMLKEAKEKLEKTLEKEESLKQKYEETSHALFQNLREAQAEKQALIKRVEQTSKIKPEIVEKIVVEKASALPSRARVIDTTEASLSQYLNSIFFYERALKDVLPIGQKSPDLPAACATGTTLCYLVNLYFPNAIDERVINTVKGKEEKEKCLENCTLAIGTAKSLGCDLSGITAESVYNEEEGATLALVVEIVRTGLLSRVNPVAHPELAELVEKRFIKQDELARLPPEGVLRAWVNYHLRGHKRRVQNFGDDFKDSEIFALLFNRLSPRRCPLDVFERSTDLDVRSEIVVSFANKLLGSQFFLTRKGILEGNETLNIFFLALLFDVRNGLSVSEGEKQISETYKSFTGTREEKSFIIWINSLGFTPKISNLYDDLKDGIVLCKVIDTIKPGAVSWSRVQTRCRNMFMKIQNCNYAVRLAKKELRLKLETTAGEDIYRGVKKLVLGLVWQLMRYHLMSILMELNVLDKGSINDSELVKWANDKVGKPDLRIRNFRDSALSSGVFLAELVEAVAPGSVNFEFLGDGKDAESKMKNANYVLSLTRKLGGVVFLLPEDIVEVKSKMLLTLVGELMRIDKEGRR